MIEIPVMSARVTEHAVMARSCLKCGRLQVPKLDLGGVVMGRQRLGINLVR